ncbi:DNA polymerase delta small subunit [Trichostrongylus colubriformis]|uniref:DNA polymerase delta small subunit n=1 Tax=Trichostrongylus colubriformis TaxID=6319 RepID=A0AAN8ERG4_TRICO
MGEMVQRVAPDYTNRSQKFLLTAEDRKDAFERQYNLVYMCRLDLLKTRIIEAGKKELGDEILYKQLEDLEMHEKAFIIGTIEKRISKRPSVLKEIAEDEVVIPEDYDPDEMMSIVSNKDFLEFEDEKQIVKLEGNISMDEVATGCTVGLYGSQVKSDVFEVEKVIWPTPCPQRPWPTKRAGEVIAFLSGLELTGDAVNDKPVTTAYELMARWLSGESSEPHLSQLSSRVERLIVLGESIAIGQAHEFASAVHYLNLNYKEASSNVETIAILDAMLSKISTKTKVDLVPGIGDPCTQQMPQQPIHRACLPKSSMPEASLTLPTNPYQFTFDGLDFLTTSGQNVSDLRRLSGVTSSCDLMKLILRWQHLVPTCPDTVDGFPFDKRDPFIMDDEFPHVMVVGNQPSLESGWFEGSNGEKCLMISVPRFSRTQTIVLLDLDTMEVTSERFEKA